MNDLTRWLAFFSQTGSEINEVSKKLGRYPDVCFTNKASTDGINKELLEHTNISFTCKKPVADDYFNYIGRAENTLVTLNGWLRIVPGAVCDRYRIFNGHPGFIAKYPELKGKDPQQKAIDLKLPTSGCIIHRVTSEVDSGEVVLAHEIPISRLTPDEVFTVLHDLSVNLWVKFLYKNL